MAIDFSFPAWLRDQHSFADSLAKGAQVGAIIANNRYRNQALAAQAIQAEREYDLREKQLNAQIKTQDLNYRLQSQAIDDQLADKTAISEWVLKRNALPLKDRIGMQMPNLRLSQSYGIVNQIADNDQKTFDSTQRNFAPGDLEKDLSFYRKLQADPDTPPEILSLAKATLESKAQKPGFSARFGPGGTLEEVVYGKSGAQPGTPTTAFQTQLQQQLHSYDKSMALLDHVEKNMNASDFGLRGMAKELKSRIGGQFGLDVPPEQLDVRNSLKQLRQDLFKALRSDSNMTGEEKQSIERMLPEVEMFDVAESLPNAVGKLLTVKRNLQNASRAAAKKLGVLPPFWTLSDEEIAAAVKADPGNKKLYDEAKQFLMENR